MPKSNGIFFVVVAVAAAAAAPFKCAADCDIFCFVSFSSSLCVLLAVRMCVLYFFVFVSFSRIDLEYCHQKYIHLHR